MIFVDYILWHYITAPREILVLLKNYSIAVWHKFLIAQHARTLFAPWHQLSARYMFPAQNPSDRIANFLVDIYIRLIAAGIRLTIIVIGLVAQVLVLVFFVGLFVAWLLWPVLFITTITRGFTLIF